MSSKSSADPVRDFYTSHPYPPPLEHLDRARDLSPDENIHRAEFHLLWPHKEYRADLDVLVAGCGTWQSAKFALTHPAARVVGIDISTTSLEHTEWLKRKYSLTNLESRWRDVLDGLRAVWPNRRLYVSGILPETWHRNFPTRH